MGGIFMDYLKDVGTVCLTGLLSVVMMFGLTKLMGSKQVSQMTMFDYVVGISMGSIAAELATELEEPLRPIIALILYGVASLVISRLTEKFLRTRSILNGKPLVLMDDGVIFRGNLKKARLDLNEFLTYCRMSGYFDLTQIQTAVLEHNGSVSFLPRETSRPVTAEDLKLKPKQSKVPVPFVVDGCLLTDNIRKAGKETSWVQRTLLQQGYRNETEVLLAVWDRESKLTVYPLSPEKPKKEIP